MNTRRTTARDRAIKISTAVEGHELANAAIRMLHEVTASAVDADDERRVNIVIEAKRVLDLLNLEQARVALFAYIANVEREAAAAAVKE